MINDLIIGFSSGQSPDYVIRWLFKDLTQTLADNTGD